MALPAQRRPTESQPDGVTLQQRDDVCMLHVAGRSLDPGQTRAIGETAISFVRKYHCRKLVVSFESSTTEYGFVLEQDRLDTGYPADISGSIRSLLSGDGPA